MYIVTDKYKLNRILMSMLDNAMKFTDKGSIEIGYYTDDQQLKLYVKDTGIGISENYLERIFDRFVQEEKELSRKFGGIGLGLSISKENAQLLGGSIRVESTKLSGSTFCLSIPYLPASSDKTPQLTTESTPTSHPYKTTILVAEDEFINYLFLDTLLKRNISNPIEILHAQNGMEAIEMCNTNTDIDLVLMDINMPVMNGFDATKTIKSLHPAIPVIAVTAYSTEADKELAFSYGFDEFLSKPIRKPELVALLQKHLSKN